MKKLTYTFLLFFVLCVFCACGTSSVNKAQFTNEIQSSESKKTYDGENSKGIEEDSPVKENEETAQDVAGEQIQPEQEQQQNSDISYIANKNTMKFHYPDCHSVDRMKEYNKKYMNCTRSQAIQQGFSPCGICNP